MYRSKILKKRKNKKPLLHSTTQTTDATGWSSSFDSTGSSASLLSPTGTASSASLTFAASASKENDDPFAFLAEMDAGPQRQGKHLARRKGKKPLTAQQIRNADLLRELAERQNKPVEDEDDTGRKRRFRPPRMAGVDEEVCEEWLALYGNAGLLGMGRRRKKRPLHDPNKENAFILYYPNNTINTSEEDEEVHIVLEPRITRFLRAHQRDGVEFVYGCLTGRRHEHGHGCILADEMGLGKTFQSIAVMWTLLTQAPKGGAEARNCVVVAPASLVRNWQKEIVQWLGPAACRIYVAQGNRAKVIEMVEGWKRSSQMPRARPVLIVSYETLRLHIDRVNEVGEVGVVVCDEGHKLKNANSGLSRAVNSLDTKRRLLLSGTPIQNDLDEFFSLVSFVNPGALGTMNEFRAKYANNIVRGRDADASAAEKRKSAQLSAELTKMCATFILRRDNGVLRQVLPAKTELVVFCRLSPLQRAMYKHVLSSKAVRKAMKDENAQAGGMGLECALALTQIVNHPELLRETVLEVDSGRGKRGAPAAKKQRGKKGANNANPSHKKHLQGMSKLFPQSFTKGGRSALAPQLSGKMWVACSLLEHFCRTGDDKTVFVSNYTRTLELVGRVLDRLAAPVTHVRLDGSVPGNKRQKIVDKFNDAESGIRVMLLSSKAGGCGLNLIGANRLIMYDPDWNPANDLQAMARVWRSGQKKEVYVYRLMSTGTIEEKMYQRQIFKTAMADAVVETKTVGAVVLPEEQDESDEAAADDDSCLDDSRDFGLKDLREIFSYSADTLCETEDKLKNQGRNFASLFTKTRGVVGIECDALYEAGEKRFVKSEPSSHVVSFVYSQYINTERRFMTRPHDAELMAAFAETPTAASRSSSN
ncbi:MAG: hypothetical protein MHM6MM_006157 [Cercozoa sp. M6MM]